MCSDHADLVYLDRETCQGSQHPRHLPCTRSRRICERYQKGKEHSRAGPPWQVPEFGRSDYDTKSADHTSATFSLQLVSVEVGEIPSSNTGTLILTLVAGIFRIWGPLFRRISNRNHADRKWIQTGYRYLDLAS